MHDFDIINDSTPVIVAKKINEGLAEISGLPIIYHKDFDINEFIGEELALMSGVGTVHYFPLVFDKKDKFFTIKNYFDRCEALRVGSFDFKEPGVMYCDNSSLFPSDAKRSFELLLSLCDSDEKREKFIDELLDLYALDIYSGQTDRPGNIYYEIHTDGSVHVGRMFDYEQSFDFGDDEYYGTDFHTFESIDDYQEFMVKYPALKTKLEGYRGVEIDKVIRKMAISRRFDISGLDMDRYKKFDYETHKKLEKILK